MKARLTKSSNIYFIFIPFSITDSKICHFFIVTGFVCLQVTEAVHFLWRISEHANAFAGVCARERVFVCVKPDQGDGSLAFYLRLSLARSPAATFALAQSNGERSNQTTRGPHSSSYLSPLLLLFEPG